MLPRLDPLRISPLRIFLTCSAGCPVGVAASCISCGSTFIRGVLGEHLGELVPITDFNVLGEACPVDTCSFILALGVLALGVLALGDLALGDLSFKGLGTELALGVLALGDLTFKVKGLGTELARFIIPPAQCD